MQKIKKIIFWLFSLFSFLCFVVLKPFSISNLLFLTAGLSIMPPVVKWINKRKDYNSKIKWSIFIILFVLGMFTYPGRSNVDYQSSENTKDYVSQSEEQVEEQEEEEKQAEDQTIQQEEEEEEKKQSEDQSKQQDEEKKQTENKTNQQEKGNQNSSVNSNENKKNSKTVYITPTGKRYHYSSECAGKNAKATTKDQAEDWGFAPCKKCAQ